MLLFFKIFQVLTHQHPPTETKVRPRGQEEQQRPDHGQVDPGESEELPQGECIDPCHPSRGHWWGHIWTLFADS